MLGSSSDTGCFGPSQGYLPLCDDNGGLLLDDTYSITFYELSKDGERDLALLPELVRNNWANNSKAGRAKTVESLQVSTQLRSTLVAQDSAVQSLLFWRPLRLHADPTQQALRQVPRGVEQWVEQWVEQGAWMQRVEQMCPLFVNAILTYRGTDM